MSKQSSRDMDLKNQARPGHGVPSQDPSPEAQIPLSDAERNREFTSSFSGSGLLTGAALMASAGGLYAGGTGLMLGGLIGAFAGVCGGRYIAWKFLKEPIPTLSN